MNGLVDSTIALASGNRSLGETNLWSSVRVFCTGVVPVATACLDCFRAFPFRRGAFAGSVAASSGFGGPWLDGVYPHLVPFSKSHLTKVEVSVLYLL
jgi:hypothetical protein